MHTPPDAGKDRPERPAGRLAGLRVLDFTWHIAGPYATRLLALAGADVLKVERPGTGDPARRLPPIRDDSGLTPFEGLNAGKRSITLNLKSPEGRLIALELARWADVAVESFSPGVMAQLGLGPDELSAANPNLVVCSVSSFGQSDPRREWKATGFTLAAMAGLLDPVAPAEGTTYWQHEAELQGGAATAAAIRQALESPGGPATHHLDIAILEAASHPLPRAASLGEGRGPALGQHNREVFLGLLGFSPGETVFLRQTGAI